MTENPKAASGYEKIYEQFDSELMKNVRREAYGEDIGQHSWVTAMEIREDIQALNLTSGSFVLDFGCGPCGPATFLAKETGCQVVGIDLSPAALAVGKRRAEEMGIIERLKFVEMDGSKDLPLQERFDAIVSYDVVLHLQNRLELFQRFSHVLVRDGKLLITDAAVLTGSISNEEVLQRSMHGYTQFAPLGYNERLLTNCGFEIVDVFNRTENLIKNSEGRIRAREMYAHELIGIEGSEAFHRQKRYLETVLTLAERGSLSRFAFLAKWNRS